MKSSQLVGLSIRLFSIWLFIGVVRYIPTLWQLDFKYGQMGIPWVTIAVVVPLLLIIFLLWNFPLTIARKLIPGDPDNNITTSLTAEELQRVGFCLIGLSVLAEAIPGVIFYIAFFLRMAREAVSAPFDPDQVGDLSFRIAGLGIGIWLLFGAKSLQNLLRWARQAGQHN